LIPASFPNQSKKNSALEIECAIDQTKIVDQHSAGSHKRHACNCFRRRISDTAGFPNAAAGEELQSAPGLAASLRSQHETQSTSGSAAQAEHHTDGQLFSSFLSVPRRSHKSFLYLAITWRYYLASLTGE
jgi:hypothetical protein